MSKYIWKKENQAQYFSIVCNEYFRGLFNLVGKKYMFYIDEHDNKKEVKKIKEYIFDGKKLDLTHFYKPKKFKHYKTFPKVFKIDDNNFVHDVDSHNVGFTVESVEEEVDVNFNQSGCGQCKERYGGGFYFSGKAYNTGLNGDKPIDYDGYFKSYNFVRCGCDDYDDVEISEDSYPSFEIRCYPKDNDDLLLTNDCVMFGLYYTDLDM